MYLKEFDQLAIQNKNDLEIILRSFESKNIIEMPICTIKNLN
jgi:hypothetical protein